MLTGGPATSGTPLRVNAASFASRLLARPSSMAAFAIAMADIAIRGATRDFERERGAQQQCVAMRALLLAAQHARQRRGIEGRVTAAADASSLQIVMP